MRFRYSTGRKWLWGFLLVMVRAGWVVVERQWVVLELKLKVR